MYRFPSLYKETQHFFILQKTCFIEKLKIVLVMSAVSFMD